MEKRFEDFVGQGTGGVSKSYVDSADSGLQNQITGLDTRTGALEVLTYSESLIEIESNITITSSNFANYRGKTLINYTANTFIITLAVSLPAGQFFYVRQLTQTGVLTVTKTGGSRTIIAVGGGFSTTGVGSTLYVISGINSWFISSPYTELTDNFIPLTGTEVNKPVTGDILLDNEKGFRFYDGANNRYVELKTSDGLRVTYFTADNTNTLRNIGLTLEGVELAPNMVFALQSPDTTKRGEISYNNAEQLLLNGAPIANGNNSTGATPLSNFVDNLITPYAIVLLEGGGLFVNGSESFTYSETQLYTEVLAARVSLLKRATLSIPRSIFGSNGTLAFHDFDVESITIDMQGTNQAFPANRLSRIAPAGLITSIQLINNNADLVFPIGSIDMQPRLLKNGATERILLRSDGTDKWQLISDSLGAIGPSAQQIFNLVDNINSNITVGILNNKLTFNTTGTEPAPQESVTITNVEAS